MFPFGSINTIYLMLGTDCNFNCEYCLQVPLKEKQLLPTEINPNIYGFINKCYHNNNDVRLMFWGGEPLLYLDTIKEIIANLDNDKLRYSTISNGSLLSFKNVIYLNEKKIHVMISWDGKNTYLTRHHNVFKDTYLKENIFKLDEFGITGVLNSFTYPKDFLEDIHELALEYYDLTEKYFGVNLDFLIDTNVVCRSLFDIDYNKLEQQMFDMTLEYFKNEGKTNFDNFTYINYISNFVLSITNYYKNGDSIFNRKLPFCNNGYSVLNMDFKGNLYSCHNTYTPLGSIDDKYFKYLNEVMKDNITDKMLEKCVDCLAVSCCKGGCKLLKNEKQREHYCKLKQAMIIPVLSIMQEFGKNITIGA
jgi:uncharacterized protein